MAASLCADCFAVSVCSSVTLRRIDAKSVSKVALSFGVIQAGLLVLGYVFGDLFVGYLGLASRWIGLLLLVYVGGSMIIESRKDSPEVRNLEGLRNVIVGAIATSIDALAVGASLSMGHEKWEGVAIDAVAVLLVTILSVVVGMLSGHHIGRRFGRVAELIGGIVLIVIGIGIFLK